MVRDNRTFSGGSSVRSGESGYTNHTGMTGVTGISRTSRIGATSGPSGSFVRLNKLVLFWTTAMTLTVLTILSYFTMAIISIGRDENYYDGQERQRFFRFLEDGGGNDDDGDDYVADDAAAADDDAAAADDDAAAGDDDQANAAGDDDAAAAGDDDQWGADNYDMGDDDQYGAVDDAIVNDDAVNDSSGSSFASNFNMEGFAFVLSWQEIIYLLMIVCAVIGLDYYGLEALKELGNKAARFRIGAFAAFVLFLGNATAAVTILIGPTKTDASVGGGIDGSPINAVSVLFAVLSVLYVGFGLALFWSERSPLISSSKREPLLEESKRCTTDNLFKFWLLLIVAVSVLLISSFALDRAEKEAAAHQSHWKLDMSLLWSAIAFGIIFFVGTISLKARGYSTKLLTGSFFGMLAGYSVLCLTFFIYFVNASAKKEYAGQITTGETAFSYISLIIAALCAAFSNAIFTYRHSIIKVNAADSGLPTAVSPPRGSFI